MQKSNCLKRLALLMLSVFFMSGAIFAQQKTVKGVVSSAGEGPIPGVSVVVKGTTTGTVTDINGAFTLEVPADAVLVFSFVGFVSQEVTVGAQTNIDVNLEADIQNISEVVVTGYSTQRKRELTGAVGVVETENIKAIPVGNVVNQLQGQASGVTVTGSGQPGSTSKLRIRGFGSFENNNPLYIVDGVPMDNITLLNPNDVESIQVLKDAGAASIYGSRASNGVIVVTTKKGNKGVKVTFDAYAGVQVAGEGPTPDLLNAQEYADLQWLVYKNDGTKETHPLYGPSTNPKPTLPEWAANTNWYDEITNNAAIQSYDLALSGGNEKAHFYASLGAFLQDGIIRYTWDDKYTTRINSDFSILDGIATIGENFSMHFGTGQGVTNLGEDSPIQMGPYRSQSIVPNIITEPIQGSSHYFVPGEYGGAGIAPRLGNASNAFANLERAKDNTNYNISMIGNVFLDVKLMDGLNFKTTLGGSWYNGYYANYTMKTYERPENIGTSSMNEGAYYGGNWTWSNILNYNKTFGDHKISALVGYESNYLNFGRGVEGVRADYFSDAVDYRTLSNGAKIQNATSYAITPRSLVSQFAKADYVYKERYILSATIRRDGSSVFSEDKRWGVFPSFAAGWRISEESFLEGVEWLNELKLRGSYGTMGNQLAVSPENAYFLYGGDPATSFYDITGAGTGSSQGFRPTRIGNPDAQWETNVTADIGVEGRILNDKIGFVFDWYSKQTEDLLFNPEMPGTAGAATVPFVNIASMSNTGVDIELNYKDNFGDLGFYANAILTSYNNEITKIAEGVEYFDWGGSRIGAYNRNMVGQPMSAFWGYKVVGLFKDAADVTNSPVQDGAEPGFFKYENVDTESKTKEGKQLIDPKDRTVIGNPNPDFTYGLNLGLTYKNFELSAFFYGSQGNDLFNNNRWWVDFWPSFQGQKSKDLLYNSWTPTNTGASVPKASNKSNFSNNTVSNSYYIEDGSYFRMKNLQVAYNVPADVVSKANLTALKLYIQGVNLFTLTKYSGLDPEIGGGDRAFGVDSGNYPLVKQFIFGVNITL